MKKMKVSGQFVQQNRKKVTDKDKGNYTNSIDGICWQERRNAGNRNKRNEKQKSVSTHGVFLIRSCGEMNVLVTCWKTCFRLFSWGDIIRRPGL